LRILATSRERLGIAGESTWRVPSLKLPAAGAARLVDALVDSEAGRLFVTRAQAVQHDFELTQSNAAAVARLCSRLDGIPLAIELAAAHVTALPPELLATRLDDSLRLLVGGGRTAPERQQTLQATLDWSYALLPETDQVVLDRLSVFAGSCSLGAAEAVCAGDGIDPTEILGALVQLVDKSLVVAEPSSGGTAQYRLLETVRQYAQSRLADREPDEATRRRHAEFYLALVERVEPELWGPDQLAWQARLEQSLDNVRVAARWLIRRGDMWRAERLGGALGDLWPVSAYSFEGRAWMTELLALGSAQASPHQVSPQVPGEVNPTAARAKVLLAFGTLETFYGSSDAGTAALEECVALCRAAGDRRLLSHALFRLAQAARFRADATAAHTLAGEGVEVSQAAGNRLEEALNLYVLAGATADLGDLDTARARAEQALSLSAGIGSKRGMGVALLILGGVSYRQGDAVAARAHLEQALAYFRGNSALPEVYALGQLGWLAVDQGDVAHARELFAESLRLERGLGRVEIFPAALVGCARLAQAEHHSELALRLAGAAASRRGGDGAGVDVIPTPLLRIDAWLANGKRRIDRAAAQEAWAEGQRMSPEHVIATALDVVTADAAASSRSSGITVETQPLTVREREVVVLIAQGFSNRRIAEQLVIAESTAALHVKNILAKLGFASRAQIAAWAVGHNLAGPPAGQPLKIG
jgi:predicted ATPase/DNA-binding CsgD family transcriptional regulator